MARSTFAAIADELGSELWRGRTGSASFARYGAHMTTAREAFAEVLSSVPERIALTHSTTGAVNLALGGLDWSAGDEIVTTDGEHPGLDAPLDELARRAGSCRQTSAGAGRARPRGADRGADRAAHPSRRDLARPLGYRADPGARRGSRGPCTRRERCCSSTARRASARSRSTRPPSASTCIPRQARSGCAARRARARCGYARASRTRSASASPAT